MSDQPFDLNSLFNSLLANPLVGGGLGLWFGGLRGGLAGASYSSDLAQQNIQNALAQQREDTLTQAIRDLTAQQQELRTNLPAYQFGGELFGNVDRAGNPSMGTKGDERIHYAEGMRPTGPGGAAEVPTINFDEMFQGPQAALDTYRSMLSGSGSGRGVGRGRDPGIDLTLDELSRDPSLAAVGQGYQTSRGDILTGQMGSLNALNQALDRTSALFGSARLDPGSLVDQVTLPSTDLAPVLAARLAGIGEASRTSQELSQQALAGSASMYGGLENLGKQSDYIASSAARDRALQGSGATAQTRMEELSAGQFNAGVQQQLAGLEAQINSALSTEQARQENVLRGNIANTNLQTGGALSELAQGYGLQQTGINQWYDQANTAIRAGNRDVGLQNAGVLAGLAGQAAQAPTLRNLAFNDAINRSLGIESGLLGNAMTGELGLAGILQPFLQQDHLSFSSLFPALFPDFGYGQSQGGGGTQFGLDLGGLAGGLAAGAGTALAGAGAGTAAGWGGLSSLSFLGGLI